MTTESIPIQATAGISAALSSTSNTSEKRDTIDPEAPRKLEQIETACLHHDIARLRQLAELPGGFINDDMRRMAWPLLLGVSTAPLKRESDDEEKEPLGSSGTWKALPVHKDEDQVELDVNRSFVFYPCDQSEAELDQNRANLSTLIIQVLRRQPYLCYFQGYHDICQVFLLVLGLPLAAPAISRLSVLRIRDFMLPNLSPTTAQLRLLPEIIQKAAPQLWRQLAVLEPFYALPGTLTMFAHNIESFHDIARLFDVLLARDPAFSLYLFAQMVIDRQDEIFEIDDADVLHVVLGKVPPALDLDKLITDSTELYRKYSPEKLRSWRNISSASALKTAKDLTRCENQSLDDGQRFFEQQARELRWADTRDRMRSTLWSYSRPAGAMGAAVAVVLLAYYVRRNPTSLSSVLNILSR